MKGLRGLFRLGTLTLLALTLMVAMALPSAAADECSSSQMLDEVEIVSVAAKESPVVWSAQDLVDFDYDGDIENGLLEVSFKDIPTDFDFDGYVIEAVPGDDDPGDSKRLGVDNYKSSSLIARPAVVGSTVTEVLNLEPGTKYYVTIYAVNHNTVQISPDQRAQDSSSATTLLSAPFLGALEWGYVVNDPANDDYGKLCSAAQLAEDASPVAGCNDGNAAADPVVPPVDSQRWSNVALEDKDYQGAHFAFYDAETEAGQHYFRWLNPADYGPFDHVLDKKDDKQADMLSLNKQADMLSLDKDGDVEDHCKDSDINGDCGHTHYQFRAIDDNGNTVASERFETDGEFTADGKDFFQTVFTAEDGDLTLSISLGRMVGGKYKAMSDTASVMFEAPDDLRALDQTYAEYTTVNTDVTNDVNDEDDIERYRDSVFAARSGYDEGELLKSDDDVKAASGKLKMLAYLNNQLK
ncbi:MAG: fibronectin type III domain-containing protein [Caldilineaceae bacterium SB0664_bin_22]|nr:fibronectin type III domain-containing protein [Caldilineaceae bacterium SB0664_bin_22]